MTRRSFASVVLTFVTLVVGCEPPTKPDVAVPPRPTIEPRPPAKRPVVFVFTASWCGACQRQKPLLAEIKATGG